MLQKLILGGMQAMDPFNANFLTTQQCLRSLVSTAPPNVVFLRMLVEYEKNIYVKSVVGISWLSRICLGTISRA